MDANSNNRKSNAGGGGGGGGGNGENWNNMQDNQNSNFNGKVGKQKGGPRQKFIVQRIFDAFFAVMVELLKRKQISTFWASIMTIIMFCQINATLFDRDIFDWRDQYFQEYVFTFCDYIHIHDAIQISGSAFYFQVLFYVAFIYNLLMGLVIVYLYYALQYPSIYFAQVVPVLQFMFLLVYSVLFFPFFDSMMSIFKCNEDGYHYIMRGLECYSSTHVGMMITSIIGLTLLVTISLLIATLYNETQPVKEDALSRLDSNFEWIMLGYRMTMSIISLYCFQDFCKWIVIVISLLSSMYFLQQYFKYLPYYDSTVSIVFGSMLGVYFWISLNALVMEVWLVSGHMTIIFIGVPLVVYVMRHLREQKIEWLMSTTLDKFQKDIDCLNQIINLQDWHRESQKSNNDVDKEIKFKGFINQHILDCESYDCVCSHVEDLYDQQTGKYLSLQNFGIGQFEFTNEELMDDDEGYYMRSHHRLAMKRKNQQQESISSIVTDAPALTGSPAKPTDPNQQLDEIHRSEVFIQNFSKQLYKDGLNKFVMSVSIHILFAYFYFNVLKNVHAALHELKIASKKKPNIYQQFTIYRYQNQIEEYIKNESKEYKNIYGQLTNVKEFERLYQEMAKQIEKVCNFQVEIWTHLATEIPDLNLLNNLNNQIVDSAAEADKFWDLLCKINANYAPALTMYGEYLTFIRNNSGAGKTFFDKAEKLSFGHKGDQGRENQSNEILFSDEAVIIHISGNKGDSGRVMKTSQGLKKVFGFDKNEVHGQNVSLLMSTIFAQKHSAFLEQYYQTGRKVMFNKERSLFAQHKTGYCFQIHIIIKQMPSLVEGVQYVGLIKPQTSDNDYIITDLNGNIDSCTPGIGQHFNNSSQNGAEPYNYKPSYNSIFDVMVKDTAQYNIQFLAPELIYFFNNRQQLKLEKFDPNATGSSSVFKNFSQYVGVDGPQRVGNTKRLQTKFSVPGGDKLTFYVPQNFVHIVKTEMNTRSGGGGRHNKGGYGRFGDTHAASMGMNGGANSQKGDGKDKVSPQFKEFMRLVQKTSKGGINPNKRISPGLKDILGCKEYKEFEIKKTLMVEIKEWIIPLGNSNDKGIKLLLFKIPKNQADMKPDEYSLSIRERNQASMTPTEYNKMHTGLKVGDPGFQEQRTVTNSARSNHQKQVTIRHPKEHNQNYSTKEPAHNTELLLTPALKQKNTMKNVNNPNTVQRNLSFANANSFNQSKSMIKQTISFVDAQGGAIPQTMPPAPNVPLTSQQSNKPAQSTKSRLPGDKSIRSSVGSQLIVSLKEGNNQSFKLMTLEDKSQLTKQGGSSNHMGTIKTNFKEDNAIDTDLLKFERQETDDMDEDDQDDLETERIDVKKDIAINDEMKEAGGAESLIQEGKENTEAHQKVVRTSTVELKEMPSVQKLFIDIGNNNSEGNIPSTLGAHQIPLTNKQRDSVRVKPPIAKQVSQAHATELEGLPQVETMMLPALPKNKLINKLKFDKGSSGGGRTNDAATDGDVLDEEMEDDMDEGGEYGDEDMYGEEGEYYEEEGDYDEEYGEEQEDVLENIDNDIRPTSGGLSNEDTHQHHHHHQQDKHNLGPSGRSGHFHRPSHSSRKHRGQALNKAASGYELRTSDIHNKDAINPSMREQPVPMQRKKLHDYSRIVTNKKYTAYDDDQETCGSAYFNDCNACENEIEIRKTIQKTQVLVFQRLQTKKVKRMKTKTKIFERAMTTSEWKKNNARASSFAEDEEELLNGNETGTEAGPSSGDQKDGNFLQLPQTAKANNTLLNSKSNVSEDLDDENNPFGGLTTQATTHRATTDDTGIDEGEQSSIASCMQSQTRTYQTLKAAMDERFVPTSIRNLRFVANLVWLSVLLLTVVYFIIQSTLFSEIFSYISIIANSEKRVDDIMTVNLKLIDIALLNEDIAVVNSTVVAAKYGYQLNSTSKNLVIQYFIDEFLTASTQLLDAQTELSLSTADLDSGARARINPQNVMMQYFDYPMNSASLQDDAGLSIELPTFYEYNMWEAIAQISVFAYRLSESPLSIVHNSTQLRFIAYNCMNSVLSALTESTQAIIDQSETARQSNNNTFLILVIAVSGALLLSMVFLLPVIKKAKDNKQEVFILLTNKKVQKQIEEQLKRTRWFISKYQQSENTADYEDMINDHLNAHGNAAGAIEENAHVPSEKDLRGGKDDDKKDDLLAKVQKQKKKWRPLDNNFVSIILRFLAILLVIESFFLYSFLVSKAFLQEVSGLTKEMRLLISRLPQLEFALLLEKELLYSNGTSVFLFQPVKEIAESSLKMQNTDYQELLGLFQANYNSHTDSYNEVFESLIYQDVCLQTQSLQLDPILCRNLNGGIQSKGVYASVVKYWTDLQQVLNDYQGSAKGLKEQKTLLNGQTLSEQQQMLELYLKPYHQQLGDMLKQDIETAFSNESASNRTVFAFFILYVIFIYLVVWRLFLRNLLEELWRAKSCLSLLPVELCFRIDDIRSFIYRNSNGLSGSAN